MSLLAEELVEEWLRRDGFFTIRGLKVGAGEIDLLAIKPRDGGEIDCRHVEVQVSHRPISYICHLTKPLQSATGRSPNSAKSRTMDELEKCVGAWILKKYHDPKKEQVRRALVPKGVWSWELVVNEVHCEHELALIGKQDVRITRFRTVIEALIQCPPGYATSGAASVELLGGAAPAQALSGESKRACCRAAGR